MLSPTCYHWHRWATLQAIAGYGCIDPSGMVAPLSDLAFALSDFDDILIQGVRLRLCMSRLDRVVVG
jgi:hypothetical protein